MTEREHFLIGAGLGTAAAGGYTFGRVLRHREKRREEMRKRFRKSVKLMKILLCSYNRKKTYAIQVLEDLFGNYDTWKPTMWKNTTSIAEFYAIIRTELKRLNPASEITTQIIHDFANGRRDDLELVIADHRRECPSSHRDTYEPKSHRDMYAPTRT